jgi:hypothetical protein
MARWVAIVALLLGVGVTAFESFNDQSKSEESVSMSMMEGGSGWPSPPPE